MGIGAVNRILVTLRLDFFFLFPFQSSRFDVLVVLVAVCFLFVRTL